MQNKRGILIVVNKEDKYDIKPKQFAKLTKSVDYNDLVKDLIPNRQTNQQVSPPYSQ